MRLTLLTVLSISLACGGPSQPADSPASDSSSASDGATAADVPVTPEKAPPPALSDAEKKYYTTTCAAIEPQLYEATKAAKLELERLLAEKGGNADQAAIDAGAKQLAEPQGLGAEEHKHCVEVWRKEVARQLFDFEPAEQAARDAVKSCVERVVTAFGKQATKFEYGSGADGAQSGPFCPDDFPVPPKLSQLPYKSKGEDWDSPTWRCLQFGLRVAQPFQLEYVATPGTGEFSCIARFLPRQGGAPIELVRSGKVDESGELKVQAKAKKRRMSAP